MSNLIPPSANAESAWSAVGRGTSVLVMSAIPGSSINDLTLLLAIRNCAVLAFDERTTMLPC